MKKYFLFGFLFVIELTTAQSKKKQIEILNSRIDSLNQIVLKRDNTISEKNTQVNALNSTKATLESAISSLNNNISTLTAEIQTCTADTKIQKEEIAKLKSQLKVKTDSLALFINSSGIEYKPSKNRFQNIQESRTLLINNKPLELYPFELFDIMTFKDVTGGLYDYMFFSIPETGEEYYFIKYENTKINGSFDHEGKWTGNEAKITLECYDGNLVRTIKKGHKYKVIYGYYSDEKMNRKPYGTETYAGYYIVDIIEMYDLFEREKQ